MLQYWDGQTAAREPRAACDSQVTCAVYYAPSPYSPLSYSSFLTRNWTTPNCYESSRNRDKRLRLSSRRDSTQYASLNTNTELPFPSDRKFPPSQTRTGNLFASSPIPHWWTMRKERFLMIMTPITEFFLSISQLPVTYRKVIWSSVEVELVRIQKSEGLKTGLRSQETAWLLRHASGAKYSHTSLGGRRFCRYSDWRAAVEHSFQNWRRWTKGNSRSWWTNINRGATNWDDVNRAEFRCTNNDCIVIETCEI